MLECMKINNYNYKETRQMNNNTWIYYVNPSSIAFCMAMFSGIYINTNWVIKLDASKCTFSGTRITKYDKLY